MPPPPARRAPAYAATGVLLALLVALLTGCGGSRPASAPPPRPTPIGDLNAASLAVPRIDFCRLVPASAVADALGAKPADTASYGNGDTEPKSGAPADVLSEIGCVWTAASGWTARAWVFARPVTDELAQTVVQQSGATKGCQAVGGPAFGKPTATQECTLADGTVRVRHAGLFGQTWLTCEVAGPSGTAVPDVSRRADAWCVEVAEALNTAR